LSFGPLSFRAGNRRGAALTVKRHQFAEAEELLRKYVRVRPTPGPGYYKLSMVERSLHQTKAADRDLTVFQTLSPTGPVPYQRPVRTSLETPDQPEDLYLLVGGLSETRQSGRSPKGHRGGRVCSRLSKATPLRQPSAWNRPLICCRNGRIVTRRSAFFITRPGASTRPGKC